MKRILAIAVFVMSFGVLATSASAESNPLLTVFEGIQTGNIPTGKRGTLANNVIAAIDAYAKTTATGWGGMYNPTLIYRGRREKDNGNLVMSWDWTDKDLKETLPHYQPKAFLEITVEDGNIISAKYTYIFLDLKITLNK